VPDLDDEQFEKYLTRFRPLIPDPLPVRKLKPMRRPRLLATAVLGAVAIVILGVVSFRILDRHPPAGSQRSASVENLGPAHPLTLREANALLETAPSYKSAMDDLAFPRQSSTVPKENQSALALLAKEKIKL
jgi:hypothetical protein